MCGRSRQDMRAKREQFVAAVFSLSLSVSISLSLWFSFISVWCVPCTSFKSPRVARPDFAKCPNENKSHPINVSRAAKPLRGSHRKPWRAVARFSQRHNPREAQRSCVRPRRGQWICSRAGVLRTLSHERAHVTIERCVCEPYRGGRIVAAQGNISSRFICCTREKEREIEMVAAAWHEIWPAGNNKNAVPSCT